MTSSAFAERRGVGLLALVSIGILIASMVLALRPAPVLAGDEECFRPLDVVFVLDKSGSMNNDANGGSPGTSSRLAEAGEAINGFIDTLQANGGVGTGGIHQVGLTTFNDPGDLDPPHTATPFGLGATLADAAKIAVGNVVTGGGSGNTPLAAGLAAGLLNMTGGDRDFVDGVAVTQAYVLLSDGRPWPDQVDAVRRPTGGEMTAYLGGADQAYSIMIGVSGAAGTAFELDPVLMDSLDQPNPAENDGVQNGGNFFAIQDATALSGLLGTIVGELLCGDLQVDKKVNGQDSIPPVAPGTDVTYTYAVTNSGVTPMFNIVVSDDKCTPVTGPVKSGGDQDAFLEVGETWTYTCGPWDVPGPGPLTNIVTATGEFIGGGNDSATDTVTVAVTPPVQSPSPSPSPTPSPTPQGSVGGQTGTPAASIPDTSTSLPGFGGPLATLIFGMILVASLGTLAYANVRAARQRR